MLQSLRTAGRKGDAYDKALAVFVLVFMLAGSDGLTQGELDSLLLALAGILATFSGTNVGEHFARKTAPAEGA
jgi:hypothetical protein